MSSLALTPAANSPKIVIIGGGPGGSVAAIAAKRELLGQNHAGDVVVIERRAYDDRFTPPSRAGEKVCAGAVPKRGLDIMDRHRIPWRDIPNASVDRLVFGNLGKIEGLAETDVSLPKNPDVAKLDFPKYGAVFERRSFDAKLLQTARETGAMVYTGAVVETVSKDENGYMVVFRCGEKRQTLHVPMVIGAFGVNPVLAKQFSELLGNEPKKLEDCATTAYRAYVPYEACPIQRGEIRGDIFTFRSGDAMHFGYRWFFGGANDVNIGVGTFMHGKDGRIDAAAIRRFFPEISDKYVLRGSPLSIWEPGQREFLYEGGCAVGIIGDAAGLVDPITGEGIREAMESGSKLGTAMAASLASKTGVPLRFLALKNKYSAANMIRTISHVLSHRVSEDPEILGKLLGFLENHPKIASLLFPPAGTEEPVFKRVMDTQILAGLIELVSDKKIRQAIAKTILDPLWGSLIPH